MIIVHAMDAMIDPDQVSARRFGYRGAMVNERFEFLTHAQFDELSQPEKIAYLTRATAALNSLWKLAKADPPSSADAEDTPGNGES